MSNFFDLSFSKHEYFMDYFVPCDRKLKIFGLGCGQNKMFGGVSSFSDILWTKKTDQSIEKMIGQIKR